MVIVWLEPLAVTFNAASGIVPKRAKLGVDIMRSLRCTVLSDTHDD